MSAPLFIELFAGLHGWGEGAVAEGFRVVGFDIVDMCAAAGRKRPHGIDLVLQDVKTLHGSQLRHAAIICASPPCQEFSKYAMPFGALWEEHDRMDDDGAPPGNYLHKPCPNTYLFWTCFRIQQEATEAAGHHIPMIVENVRGAARFIGRSSWNFGSFHLYGDVPALMPINLKRGGKGTKPVPNRGWTQGCAITLGLENYAGEKGAWDNTERGRLRRDDAAQFGQKVPGFRFDGSGRSFQNASVKMMRPNEKGMADDSKRMDGGYDAERGADSVPGSGSDEGGMREPGSVLSGMGNKGRSGGGWFGDARGNVDRRQDPRDVRKQPDGSWATPDGTKIGGDCKDGGRSSARKQASAQIAKIPFELARHIAATYKPR